MPPPVFVCEHMCTRAVVWCVRRIIGVHYFVACSCIHVVVMCMQVVFALQVYAGRV